MQARFRSYPKPAADLRNIAYGYYITILPRSQVSEKMARIPPVLFAVYRASIYKNYFTAALAMRLTAYGLIYLRQYFEDIIS